MKNNKDKILVTGAAGFIGAFLSKELVKNENYEVIGIDNLNDYYDVRLKDERLKLLASSSNFSFIKGDIANKNFINKLFKDHQFDYVIHLAAQAGVRHSISHPEDYVSANLVGMFNILEACRYNPVKHLVYASSSSVYGANTKVHIVLKIKLITLLVYMLRRKK